MLYVFFWILLIYLYEVSSTYFEYFLGDGVLAKPVYYESLDEMSLAHDPYVRQKNPQNLHLGARDSFAIPHF